jgi:hypothetical protein
LFVYSILPEDSGHSIFSKKQDRRGTCAVAEKMPQKLSKTKDPDMVKNFFVMHRCLLKIQKLCRHNFFVCRNRYRTCNSVDFVPGGTIFGTLCTTQDETMSTI